MIWLVLSMAGCTGEGPKDSSDASDTGCFEPLEQNWSCPGEVDSSVDLDATLETVSVADFGSDCDEALTLHLQLAGSEIVWVARIEARVDEEEVCDVLNGELSGQTDSADGYVLSTYGGSLDVTLTDPCVAETLNAVIGSVRLDVIVESADGPARVVEEADARCDTIAVDDADR